MCTAYQATVSHAIFAHCACTSPFPHMPLPTEFTSSHLSAAAAMPDGTPLRPVANTEQRFKLHLATLRCRRSLAPTASGNPRHTSVDTSLRFLPSVGFQCVAYGSSCQKLYRSTLCQPNQGTSTPHKNHVVKHADSPRKMPAAQSYHVAN